MGADRIHLFDAHSHTGEDIDGSKRSAEEQLADLEAIGGRSVIFPFCVDSGYGPENRRVLGEAERDRERLVPFARLDPRVDGRAEAATVLAAGARGLKLHPRGEDFRLGHPAVDGIFAAAGEARAPVLIHAGVGVGSFRSTITDLAERHRDAPMILAHAGISDLSWLWRVLPEHPNIHFDTAWWTPVDLLALFALVPPGRILFGSDAPYMGVEISFARTLRCARHAGLSADAIEVVFGAQLEALLSGGDPIDGGPAPGPRVESTSPTERRAASALTALGGCLLGGGDPATFLELAAATVEPGGAGAGRDLDPRITELVEVARSRPEEAIDALSFALCLATAPGVGAEIALA